MQHHRENWIKQKWQKPSFVCVLLFVFNVSVTVFQNAALAFNYAPDRNSVPLAPSIEIDGSVGDYVEFLYNRGKGSVTFKDTVLQMLSPNYIRSIKGFKSYKSTRIDISVYEFRLLESLAPIENLLKKGIQLRFVAESSTFKPFVALSDKQYEELSREEKETYIKSYDRDGDGFVGPEDVRTINEDKFVSIEAHRHLRALQKKYPKQVELIEPPLEILSSSQLLPFPRIHHLKDISIDFYKDNAWHSQVSLRSSANLTDSCMNQRIAISHGNKLRYVNLNFEGTNYAKGSQGNIQFGAIFKGEQLLESIQKVKEEWISLYKKKKHFDEGKLSDTILPRIVINDPKGHRTTIETFYSEGTKSEGRKKIDPVLVALHNLSSPDKSLRVYYSSQFVSTHHAKNQALRYHIDKAGSRMEDFFVVVDGNFATQPYSTLPQLAFAPNVSLQFATLDGKSIRDLPLLPEKLDWENSIGVYEGGKDVYGAPADKLHAKVDYYEYVTKSGERHYMVVWGSANSSKNSAKGNADSIHVLDTTDPSVGKIVKNYFRALRTDPRVFPYSQAYLDKKFREAFNWDQRILNEDFLKTFSEYLSGQQSSVHDLKVLVSEISKAKAHHEIGYNLLKLLKWYSVNVPKPLTWSDFYVLVEIAHPQKMVPESLVRDLLIRWNVSEADKVRSLNRLFKDGLKKSDSFGTISKNMSRILNNCSTYLKRLGVRQSPESLFAGAGAS